MHTILVCAVVVVVGTFWTADVRASVPRHVEERGSHLPHAHWQEA